MMRSTWTHLLASVLALAIAQPATAAVHAPATEPEPAAPRHATVEIDTSDIGEEGPVIKRRTRERTDVVLRAAGVLPARPGVEDPVIHVDIDELFGDEPGYQCQVWIAHGDVVVGERRRVECTLCTESEIVQRVEATVAELVAVLPAAADDAVDPADATDDASAPTESAASSDAPVDDATSSSADGKRLGALGKTGAALIAVGVAGAAAGAVLVALPPKVDLDDPLYETTYRPPGYATLAAGGAALVTGIVLLVVDRRRARTRTTALVPSVGPSTAGLVWSGRF